MKYCFFLFLSLFAFCCPPSMGESRTWTDTKGKTVEGTPTKKTSTSITITLENGKSATIPLARLSQEDKDFVASWSPSAPPSETTDKNTDVVKKPASTKPTPNFDAPWPKNIRIPIEQDIKLVKEEEGLYTYETEHFTFEVDAKVSLKLMRTLSCIFEATFEANCALPLNFPCLETKANPSKKYKAKFYQKRSDYEKASYPLSNSAGVFINGVVHVPFSSLGVKAMGKQFTIGREGDPKTLIHEITHQMSLPSQERPGPIFPIWFAEGLAEYVGSTPYQSGAFNFIQTKNNLIEIMTGFEKKTMRGRNIGKDFNINSLKKFIEQSTATFQSSEPQISYGFTSLLFYYFCHVDGKGDSSRLKNYVKAIQEGKTPDEANLVLLDGRSWADLAKDVNNGMRKGMKLKPTIGE